MSKQEAIEDWLSIIDYKDKEQCAWCRRNITKIRKYFRNNDNRRFKSGTIC